MRAAHLLAVLLFACSSDPAGGPVVDAGPANGDSGKGDGDPHFPDARTGDARGPDATPDARDLVVVPDPGPPQFPQTVTTVSVAVRTGPAANDGADGHLVNLCLTATDCYRLDARDVNDFRVGKIDVYHFYGLNLPRSAIDRVELRTVSGGSDMWHPDCLEVQLDGQPVHCADNLTARIGTGNAAGEAQSWRDPMGLHSACTTCSPDRLTHGPMIGAVEPDLARVWVRTDATRPVALRMTRDATASLATAPTVDWAYPSPTKDYAAVLTARGLRPGQTYRYAVQVDGVLGAVHSLVAAPPAGSPGHFSMAFGSCTRLESQPIFSEIASLAPDVFLFLGDNHYGNTDDLDSLRWYYRWAHAKPERAAMMAMTPTIATWDDHDYVGNNTLGNEPGRNTALRVFKDSWGNPSAGLPATAGTFFRYAYGDVELFVVDDRYWRGLEDDILGTAQTAWLVDAMDDSTATFKLLACGSQFTQNGSDDSWATYRAARDRLFDQFVTRRVEGVVLLSGDVHRGELRKIPRRAAGGYDLYELTSSPLANTNFDCRADPSPVKDLIACHDDGNFFIRIESDTTLADPALDVTLHDHTGAVREELNLKKSQLSF